MRRLLLSFVLTTGSTACEDDAPGRRPDAGAERDAGDESPEAGAPDDAGREDAGSDAGTFDASDGTDPQPLLEREPRAPLSCQVATALLNYKPRSFGYTGNSLVTEREGAVWIARVEGDGADPWHPANKSFLLSTLASDGALGASTIIPVADIETIGRPAMAALPDGGAVLTWSEGSALRFATFDGNGAPVVAPKTVFDQLGIDVAPAIAVSTSGRVGIAWVDRADYSSSGVLKYLSIGIDSQTDPTPISLGAAAGLAPAGLTAAPDGGFALVWQEGGPYPEPYRLAFAAVTDAGDVAISERQVASAEGHSPSEGYGFDRFGPALTRLDDAYLAAWSEGSNGFETFGGAYRVVRLRKIGLDGSLADAAVTLREKVIDIDEVTPRFVHFGDALGLSWGRGTHIYGCAGCVPDDSLQFVLLDPTDLTPRSNVLAVPPDPARTGGLVRSQAAVAGDDILFTTEITFHTWQEPGFTAVHCE